MVTEPGIVSLAGGAFVTVWPAGSRRRGHRRRRRRDARASAGRRGRPVSVAGRAHRLRRRRDDDGRARVGRGARARWRRSTSRSERFGRLPWREVVAPAQEVARTGFPLGSASGYYLPYVRDSAFGWDPADRAGPAAARTAAGSSTGDLMQIAGLGDTVRLIAEEGARTLYDGELAAAVVADMAERGGLVTAADLAAYQPLLRPALPVRDRRLGAADQPAARRSAARCWRRCSPCSATARPAVGRRRRGAPGGGPAPGPRPPPRAARRRRRPGRRRLRPARARSAGPARGHRARRTCRWSTPTAPRARSRRPTATAPARRCPAPGCG